MTTQGQKKTTAIDVLEGASVLIKLARNLESSAFATRERFVKVQKTDLVPLVRALRLGAQMIDTLTYAVERGDRFNEKLER